MLQHEMSNECEYSSPGSTSFCFLATIWLSLYSVPAGRDNKEAHLFCGWYVTSPHMKGQVFLFKHILRSVFTVTEHASKPFDILCIHVGIFVNKSNVK
jgi:hypothetical protein